ncbi:MAG: hypothetical protein MUP70_13775, partial [Candidatus Aminicenantes bacterium]|nr:hypothetical protein [Candidatus Aminicenantes bacterium]
IQDMGSANGIIIPPSSVLRNGKKGLKSADQFQIGEILFKLLAIDQDDDLKTMTVDIQELLKQQPEENISKK